MAAQPADDRVESHPFWEVQIVFDPDGTGADFAYTIGLHTRGLPELHIWARPSLGDDPGADWMLSTRDRGSVLNELAGLMVDGRLGVGSEVTHEYDGGHTRVTYRVDPPGDCSCRTARPTFRRSKAPRLMSICARHRTSGPMEPSGTVTSRMLPSTPLRGRGIAGQHRACCEGYVAHGEYQRTKTDWPFGHAE